MSTIKKEITVSSVALMSGAPCEARLVPSSEKGIRLHFANQTIEAKANNVELWDRKVLEEKLKEI